MLLPLLMNLGMLGDQNAAFWRIKESQVFVVKSDERHVHVVAPASQQVG